MQSRKFIYFACYCSDYLDKDQCTSFSFLFSSMYHRIYYHR
ncbi:hypothetical protein OIU74_023818 [Salix koriyanagi]|uniref:Uncharacterized protein n=1 Tax=Salix koriyanagi TaxID=2511006 RepID=A0A9Q1ABH8_9ROSI|nr:hypothetical protein OIU74_023818 [Salix koriyanagi]